MNTVICDADTSDLADMLGPVILLWCKDLWGFRGTTFYRDRVVQTPDDDVKWCLSELLPAWTDNIQTADDFDDWWDRTEEVHEGCRWQ